VPICQNKKKGKRMNMKICCVLTLIFFLLMPSIGMCADFESLLAKGKQAIEAGEYQEATDCVGKLLIDSPNNETKDPRAIAFSSTVMAYGMIHSNSSGTDALIEAYLKSAIKADPTWPYPQKLLDEYEQKIRK
jgi:hypothetical protein